MTFQIAIIGLNQVGASIGLAMSAYKDKITTIGFDRSSSRLKMAKQEKWVDQTEGKLLTAIQHCNLVLLCEEYSDATDSLEKISETNLDGKYVFDIGWNKQAMDQQFKTLAPGFAHSLHFQLTKNPKYLFGDLANDSTPFPDLFEHGTMALATTSSTSSEAVDLATTLAKMLKVEIMFCDLAELDGLIAGAEQFPHLMAASLVMTANAKSGWIETQKLTGDAYFGSTSPLSGTSQPGAASFYPNRDNLLHWVDAQMSELQSLREALASDDDQLLLNWYKQAFEQHQILVDRRSHSDWAQKPVEVERESLSARLGRLIGLPSKKS